MYLKFGQVCIWPPKSVVQATMPADFKEKFLSTRVIIMGGAPLGLMVDMQPACVWLLGIVLG